MARDDDSFWLDIFRKSPLIATFMAICGVIGFGIGLWLIIDLEQATRFRRGVPIRGAICFLFSTSCGGIFVGLIAGVILDTVLGSLWKRDDKKRRDKKSNRIGRWE